MNTVTTLSLPQGFDIDILIKNGKIGYTFSHDGQNYGQAVTPKSRKVADIAAACLLLIINAEETYKELTKDQWKIDLKVDDVGHHVPFTDPLQENPEAMTNRMLSEEKNRHKK